jgi:hypothetical protein
MRTTEKLMRDETQVRRETSKIKLIFELGKYREVPRTFIRRRKEWINVEKALCISPKVRKSSIDKGICQ